MNTGIFKRLIMPAALLFTMTTSIFAHCDSVEGPVVKAAKEALKSGNVNHVLIWVPAESENEIKEFFQKVQNVRNINEQVRELADLYFFETLVRIHRVGEGVGYTGLKSAEFTPEKGIESADLAIQKNSVQEILEHVNEAEHEKVRHYFQELILKKDYNINDVDAGREYVESYVHFIHYVEGLYSGIINSHEHHNH